MNHLFIYTGFPTRLQHLFHRDTLRTHFKVLPNRLVLTQILHSHERLHLRKQILNHLRQEPTRATTPCMVQFVLQFVDFESIRFFLRILTANGVVLFVENLFLPNQIKQIGTAQLLNAFFHAVRYDAIHRCCHESPHGTTHQIVVRDRQQ